MICSRRVSNFRRGLSAFPQESRSISASLSTATNCRDRLNLARSRSATAVYEEAASLSPHIPGRPTGAESGCARAASPETVEPSGELDARRSNIVHRKEKDRPGMRVRRAGDEDRDEAVAQRFGLNAELPFPFHRHEHNGKLPNLGDAQGACALLFQIFVSRNLRQNRRLQCVYETLRDQGMGDEPSKKADERDHCDRKRRRHADAQVRNSWNVDNNGL